MALDELHSAVTLGAAAAVVAAGLGWQLWRRRTFKPRVYRPNKAVSEDRRDERGAPIPNDTPSKDAVQKTDEVYAFESVNVKRPTMLAVTAHEGDATAAELFIQRAYKIDREHWRELPVSEFEKRDLSCLFAYVNKLDWVPGSAFERHIYAVSFSPVLEEALKQGYHPRANATAADLQFCCIDENGKQLGEPMLMPDHAWGQTARVHALWCALNPADKPHELAGELFKEVETLKQHLEKLAPHVAALTLRTWQQRVDEIVDLAHDLRRLGPEEGAALERNARTDVIAANMRMEAKRIDDMVAERAKSVHTLEEADEALVHAIAFMHVRELIVRVLRICAIMRVIGGDSFEREVHCANHVTSDIAQFTDVRPLLNAVQALAHTSFEDGAARALADSHVEKTGAVYRHSKELLETHDALVEELQQEAGRVQYEIDRCLLCQSRPRRYAVRVSDDGAIEKFFILDV